MTYLNLDRIGKRYGERTVLNDVSLKFEAGEFISLLGPSGCGKTTLLRIVAGFEFPDEGQVWLAGRNITNDHASKRQMGMVFQAYSLFPNMTAEENVRFGLRVRRQSADAQRKRSGELLELVGLDKHMHKYPHQMSGGQQQRVALARALAISPALLLLDEPLSALDAKVRVQLRDEIRRIQQETGITTLFVTHDQEEALSISDRVVVMQEGALAQIGEPSAIYGEPANLFVARFVGAAAEVDAGVIDGSSGIVEILGRRVPASRARGMANGTKVRFLLRPESVRLNHPTAEGILSGRVVARTFFGVLTNLRVEIDGSDTTFTASMASAEAAGIPQGSNVTISWDADAPRLLPII